MRVLAPTLVLAAALAAGCGGSGKHAASSSSRAPTAPSAPATTVAQTSPIRVTLTGQSHHPRVGKPWHYVVRVTDAAGRPVPARIHLQITFGGEPVGQIGVHRVRNGVWSETFGAPGNAPFPAQARGQPLALEAIVTAKRTTVSRSWWIVVR